jgi:hypothetical protein
MHSVLMNEGLTIKPWRCNCTPAVEGILSPKFSLNQFVSFFYVINILTFVNNYLVELALIATERGYGLLTPTNLSYDSTRNNKSNRTAS